VCGHRLRSASVRYAHLSGASTHTRHSKCQAFAGHVNLYVLSDAPLSLVTFAAQATRRGRIIVAEHGITNHRRILVNNRMIRSMTVRDTTFIRMTPPIDQA
jgi:hypothetical protein